MSYGGSRLTYYVLTELFLLLHDDLFWVKLVVINRYLCLPRRPGNDSRKNNKVYYEFLLPKKYISLNNVKLKK